MCQPSPRWVPAITEMRPPARCPPHPGPPGGGRPRPGPASPGKCPHRSVTWNRARRREQLSRRHGGGRAGRRIGRSRQSGGPPRPGSGHRCLPPTPPCTPGSSLSGTLRPGCWERARGLRVQPAPSACAGQRGKTAFPCTQSEEKASSAPPRCTRTALGARSEAKPHAHVPWPPRGHRRAFPRAAPAGCQAPGPHARAGGGPGHRRRTECQGADTDAEHTQANTDTHVRTRLQ